jgi:hypothetical protein
MESHIGRKIKGDHELVSLSSWMEVSNENKFTNKIPQPIDNQKPQMPVQNTSQIKSLTDISEPDNSLKPRIYHYLFAHKYLPDKLSESSQGVISWLAGEKGIEHLKTRWTLLPTVYNIESKDYIEPIGINRYVLKPTSQHTIILVQFPEPERISEAFFSAILIQPNNSYRYFTLERTFGNDNNGIPIYRFGRMD